MSEQQSHGELVNELLSQDKGISESHFEDVRMNIEQTLNKAEQQEKRMRRAIVVAVCVLFLSFPAIIPFQFLGPKLGDWVLDAWIVCMLVSFVCTIVFSLLYFVKYRPAVSRSRNELQTTILSDLQRQVALLAKGLDQGKQ